MQNKPNFGEVIRPAAGPTKQSQFPAASMPPPFRYSIIPAFPSDVERAKQSQFEEKVSGLKSQVFSGSRQAPAGTHIAREPVSDGIMNKQSQFGAARLGSGRSIVQNKANFGELDETGWPVARSKPNFGSWPAGPGAGCTNKPNSRHCADSEIGVPGGHACGTKPICGGRPVMGAGRRGRPYRCCRARAYETKPIRESQAAGDRGPVVQTKPEGRRRWPVVSNRWEDRCTNKANRPAGGMSHHSTTPSFRDSDPMSYQRDGRLLRFARNDMVPHPERTGTHPGRTDLPFQGNLLSCGRYRMPVVR